MKTTLSKFWLGKWVVAIGLLMLLHRHAAADTPITNSVVYLPVINHNFNPAWVWGNPITVTLSPAPWHAPLAIIDHTGQLHLMWDTATGARFIYHTYLTSQGWVSPTAIAPTLGVSEIMYPPLVDAQGTIHVAWRNNLGTGVEQPMRLMYAQFANGMWGAEEVVYQGSSSLQGMLHVDEQDNIRLGAIIAASFSGSTYDFARTPQGWTSYGPFSLNAGASWVWPDMQGGMRFYADAGSNAIKYSWGRDGSVIIREQLFSGGKVSGRDTQLDGQNNLHTFWTNQVPVPGGYVNGVYHQCFTKAMTWGKQITLSGVTNIAAIVGKASDNHTQAALAYQKATTNEIEITLLQECMPLANSIMPTVGLKSVEFKTLTLSPTQLCAVLKQNSGATAFAVVCATLNY